MDGRQDQIVYGYTDNLPVGPALQRAGISDNIDPSSRRADNFVPHLARRQHGDIRPVLKLSQHTPQW
jgi:hypothetical protein